MSPPEPLPPPLQDLLDALLERIVVPCPARGLPGGSAVGLAAALQVQGRGPWLLEGLRALAAQGPGALADGAAFEALKRQHFPFLNELSRQLMHCYYQDAHVMRAIGLEASPAFPRGNHLEGGDLTLLEPVYERGSIFRSVD